MEYPDWFQTGIFGRMESAQDKLVIPLLARCVDSQWHSRKYPGRNGTKVTLFWCLLMAKMFSARSVVFLFGRAFIYFVFVWLLIIWPQFYSVLGSLIEKTSTGGNEENGCVCVRYNSSFISSPLFNKRHKTSTLNSHIMHIWETVTKRRPIFRKFSRLSSIFCWGYSWLYKQTEWI